MPFDEVKNITDTALGLFGILSVFAIYAINSRSRTIIRQSVDKLIGKIDIFHFAVEFLFMTLTAYFTTNTIISIAYYLNLKGMLIENYFFCKYDILIAAFLFSSHAFIIIAISGIPKVKTFLATIPDRSLRGYNAALSGIVIGEIVSALAMRYYYEVYTIANIAVPLLLLLLFLEFYILITENNRYLSDLRKSIKILVQDVELFGYLLKTHPEQNNKFNNDNKTINCTLIYELDDSLVIVICEREIRIKKDCICIIESNLIKSV